MSGRKQQTPEIPDLSSSSRYITFDPCQHLQQVISTQAKNTALKNYKLGLKVSLLSSETNVRYENRGDSTIVEHEQILALRSKALKCRICSSNCGSLYICLQCNNVGCFRKGHAFSHAKSAGHVFGIDCNTGSLFCFRCGTFVGHPLMEDLRIRHIQDHKYNSHCIQPVDIDQDITHEEKILNNSRAPTCKASTGLRGFVNMGATCFMSTIIQTLIHNPIIRNYFLAGKHYTCKNDPTSCIPCCLDEIFTAFYSEDDTKGFGPTSLLTAAWKVKRSLAGYSEQDAHEFWQFLLDEIHKAEIAQKQHAKNGSQLKADSPCPCIVHTTFSGQLQSSITCSSCERVRTTVDMMLDLSLEVAQPGHKKVAGKSVPSKSLSLIDCLTRFTTPEKLDVLYSCDSCGERASAYKQLQIKTLPQVLGIQLKRFEHSAVSSKIETHVQFPLILDMKNYVLQPEDSSAAINDTDLTYELFAIVCHIGSVNTGHYVCMVKNRDNNWFKFDDAVVTLVSKESVLSTKAYLLYYIVRDI